MQFGIMVKIKIHTRFINLQKSTMVIISEKEIKITQLKQKTVTFF